MNDKVYIDISARHVHLSKEVFEELFGKDAEMTSVKKLTGAFICEQHVDITGPKGSFKGVTILGPYRKTQIELSMTDARKIGVDAPIRISGDTEGSAPIKITGPCGEVEIKEGAIVAKRHIHFSKDDAAAWGFEQNQAVKVRVDSNDRSLVFDDVLIRIGGDHPALMHIDTDECNAAGLTGPTYGHIVV